MNNIKSITSGHLSQIKSKTEDHFHNITSVRSQIREIHPNEAANDVELLAQIGYKQELRRHYSTLQVFGIAFSIMGLLPSISSTIAIGLEAGPAGLVWGWFLASIFIFCTGVSMAFLGSAIPTSGGLYYYTNYYAPDAIRVPLSFLIGCSNSIGLIGGLCSISYGFAVEVLSAVFIQYDGNFEITDGKCYGIFAACIVSNVIISCLTTKYAASWQTASIIINSFLVILFLIAVPAGKKHDFNSAEFIFTNFENARSWGTPWSFALSWMPAIWTIGAFDSAIHCSEEAKNAQKSIPWGILGSIGACWIFGWFIVIVCAACIKDGDTARVLTSDTGNPMAQIIYDSLGKKWAVAFMAMIAVGQYMMSVSILIAASRQIWSFARDDGLPIIYNFVKYVNPKIQVPVRATIFGGAMALIMGLLVLIGPAGANALFSLAVASNLLAWGMPVLLVLLPMGRARFISGPFYFGKVLSNIINFVTVCWVGYVIVLCMFPDSKSVDKESMNYTVVINGGLWVLSLIYFYVWGYRSYTGPISNLDEQYIEGSSVDGLDEVLAEKA
ncbi:uncharacterized protein SPAPADRAFT_133471 [Spathaspora passalidarum NRRL Y-27907]|uniref:GABA-specific permease n=1 Tax=Spathaspora passalidarum (strain NRRL Y-27907 / 11-Y1) TaxID=619300 RepID=G3AHL2_SPAPN|nr:uncharacterized protein SPAPADRAFT_133471 [Spathaspora passalidarum NRRL Y-27907]EGW34176.1 hypothetical protein SPAPADRAFT_133471 [Spathaspora passalidarum NRRL Y-27907]